MTAFERVLFVGTGGGNDIFSTVLAMSALKANGRNWKHADIAGVLSPFHRHAVEKTETPNLYRVTPESTRSLLRGFDRKQISFVDARVAAMVQDHSGSSVFGLSLHRGSIGLANTFRALNNRYDLIVLVDIGGDIFYAGARDTHVLSPFFDAMILRAFVDSGAHGFLFEAGPGTDGELEPEALRESLELCGAEGTPIPEKSIALYERAYRKWIEPYRTGRTVPITIAAYRSNEREIVLPYRVRAHIGEMRWYTQFKQRIATDLCKNFYLVDPKKIQNPLAIECRDPFDWFYRTQILGTPVNCEANLEYVNVIVPEPWYPQACGVTQFLTPSPLFPEEQRIEMINYALDEQMREFVCGEHVLFMRDWEKVKDRWEGSFHLIEKETYVCLQWIRSG